MKKILIALVFLFLLFTFSPQPVHAQFQEWGDCVEKVSITEKDATGTPKTTISEVPTLRCLPVVFRNVVSGFLILVGVFALFLIIYSGIRLVTSGGDPKKVESARKIMNYAIIGVIVVLSSFAIIYFIAYITNSEKCITDLESIEKGEGGCK